jgi:hypothetical protein
MITYTSYAEQKFEILNRHKVYITREQIADAILVPDKLNLKDKHACAHKDGVGVVYRKDGEFIRVLTFYPIRNKN